MSEGSSNPHIWVTKESDASEPSSAGQFRFHRTGSTEEVTVDYTVGGTATPGTDYSALSGSVSFGVGVYEINVAVPALDDMAVEEAETVIVSDLGIEEGGEDYTFGGPATATITDNDSASGGMGSYFMGASLYMDTDHPYAGEEITFDVWSDSEEPMEFALVEWDLAYDGATFHPDATAEGASISQAFSTLGSHTVAARVTDALGSTGVLWVTFTVHHPAPVVTAPADFTVTSGDTRPLPITVETDVPITSIEWWVSYDGEYYDFDPSLTGLSPNYYFETFGNYEFWVTVTDANGETGEAWFKVTADEPVPEATVTASGPIDEGNWVTFTLNQFDPDTLNHVSIYADWTGAGDFDLVPADEWLENTYVNGVASFRHWYDDGLEDGYYQAVIRVENQSGESTPYIVDVLVANTDPSAILTAGNEVPRMPGALETVWGIGDSAPVRFINIEDDSDADYDELKFHFIITPDGSTSPGEEIVSTEPWVILPDYTPGSAWHVEGWVTDKDGGESYHEKFVAVVAGVGKSNGGGATDAQAYGTMEIEGEGLPGDYNRYGLPRIEKKDYAEPSITVQMRLGAGSQGGAVRFVCQVVKAAVPSGAVISSETVYPGDGRVTVEGLAPNQQISISGIFEVNVDGMWTRGTNMCVVQVFTPREETLLEQLDGLRATVESMMSRFGSQASALVSAVMDHPGAFFSALAGGVEGAVTEILANMSNPDVLMGKLLEWVGGSGAAMVSGFDASKLATNDGRIAFLLNFSGLTWSHVQQVLVKELGVGNMAAVETVAGWLEGFDTNDPMEILRFLREKAETMQINPEAIINQVVNQAKGEIIKAVAKATPLMVAKFVPGAGAVLSIVKTMQWLLSNQDQLEAVFTELVEHGVDALIDAANSADIPDEQEAANALTAATARLKTSLVNAFNTGLIPLLNFLAGQVGLGNLPKDIHKVVSYVPANIDKQMVAAVRRVAKNLKGGTTSGKSDGLLGGRAPKEFTHDNKTYELWVTKESEKVFVKVGIKGGTSQPISLRNKDFIGTAGANFNALESMAKSLTKVGKPGGPQTSNPIKTMSDIQKDLVPAEDKLIRDIKAGKCNALEGGCFVAGTKLWTPSGYRKIEEIRQGEEVYSRDQHKPAGLIEAKFVEKIFVRLSEVWNLHVGGQVIGTTGEHPFYAYAKGWIPADQLTENDWILTESGEWQKVEESWNSGEVKKVYNLRIADYHTYFVGEDYLGWAIWAHNDYVDTPTDYSTLDDTAKNLVRSAFAEADGALALSLLLRGKYKDKAVASSNGKRTISGFSETGQPSGFEAITPEAVKSFADSREIFIRGSRSDSAGQGVYFKGKYYASHAEKKMIVANTASMELPIGVSQAMCTDCGEGAASNPQTFFRQLAMQSTKQLTVASPLLCRIFQPDGTVLAITRPATF